MFDNHTRFRVNPETTGKVIDGEAVIIHLGTGVYYSLNPSGSYLWELISQGWDHAAVVRALAARYGIAGDQARRDVEALAARLLEEGLITPGGQAEPQAAVPASGADSAYEPPALAVYTDMADLLALDPPVPGLMPDAWDYPDNDSPEDSST